MTETYPSEAYPPVPRPNVFQTKHGMYWYPEDAETVIAVERLVTIFGTAVLGVRTTNLDPDHQQEVQIAVSPKGRSIRVWLNGKQLREVTDE